MFGFIDVLKMGAGAIAGFVVGAAFVSVIATVQWIPQAKNEARQQERAAALQKSMDLIQERSKTNEQISKMDNSALCAALNGNFINGVCQ